MVDIKEEAPDYREIWDRIRMGRIVPFLGAGASACYGLPSGANLAATLVAEFEFPGIQGREDLTLVASYVVQKKDSIVLQRSLRKALVPAPQPGELHRLLAGCEAITLYVTTNYDDLLEVALEPRRPWVVVDRGEAGTVACRSPDGKWRDSKSESLRAIIKNSRNPIVLKLHGSIAAEPENDSFLITEDQYVDFLGRSADRQIPSMLVDHMSKRSFLFLGYALRDWNVRVLLRKVHASRSERITSWGIVRDAGEVEKLLWLGRNVELHDMDLKVFTTELAAAGG